MPRSTPKRSRARSGAATAATARPIANATRMFLPGCTSGRTRAIRHKAVPGFVGANPAPQLDSMGSLAPQPISAMAAIVTATEPATWLACCLFRLPAGPTNSIAKVPKSQNLNGRRTQTSGRIYPATFQISVWAIPQTTCSSKEGLQDIEFPGVSHGQARQSATGAPEDCYGVKGRGCDYVGIATGVPPTAVDLRRCQSRQPWAKSGRASARSQISSLNLECPYLKGVAPGVGAGIWN